MHAYCVWGQGSHSKGESDRFCNKSQIHSQDEWGIGEGSIKRKKGSQQGVRKKGSQQGMRQKGSQVQRKKESKREGKKRKGRK